MRLMPLPNCVLKCGSSQLDLAQPQVMGILNVTPDSFSDGGRYHQKEQAFAHAMQMIADGANLVDIGGESTRPGATPVDIDEEIRRVIPVVERLAKENVIISVDTSQPEVMRAAVDAGAQIWNDVRALTRPQALETAAELNIPVVLMHMRGEPTTMNQLAQYHDVTTEVIQELQQRIDQAIAMGISPENIVVDPGFGFAKNAVQNLKLLQELWKLQELGYPVMSALSRKRFIGEALGGVAPDQRINASVAAHLLSIQQGASMVRVHDVKATVEAIQVWQAMLQA